MFCLFYLILEIRRGRYTLQDKTKIIKEVKRLKQWEVREEHKLRKVTEEQKQKFEELVNHMETIYEPFKAYTPDQVESIQQQQHLFLVSTFDGHI